MAKTAKTLTTAAAAETAAALIDCSRRGAQNVIRTQNAPRKRCKAAAQSDSIATLQESLQVPRRHAQPVHDGGEAEEP